MSDTIDVPEPEKKRGRPPRTHALTNLRPADKGPRKRVLRAKDIAEVERMKRALEMRKRGDTFDMIASELGFHDASGASKFVKRALELTVQESSEEVRRMELERYDVALKGLSKGIEAGDARSIEVAIKLYERRAKLLGLDAPERKELAVDGELRNVTMGIDATNPETRAALHTLLRQRPALPTAQSTTADVESTAEEDPEPVVVR